MDALSRHFERLYLSQDDPWNVRSSWYERRKRALLMGCMNLERYGHALELGCGNGDMTVLLADRCNHVTAVDVSATAVRHCRAHISARRGASVAALTMSLPDEWPDIPRGGFDLTVVSEIAYYLDDHALGLFLARIHDGLQPGGELIACHWRHDFSDRRQQTDALHESMAALPGMTPLVSHQEADFRLDTWRRDPLSGEHGHDRRLHPGP
ncbi:class I SAM-dependent methyltransferase [Achromobacter pestifer]|uniref:Methyltransferase domain-containing protein n=1 Tax=Achromobacter pestifer TaxID=1353889 RepID=A0A6S6YK85_9BURK|nr:class I SAM-dependent methyltransferase [Achromobacter pestifer]CAB3627920.1 hypothetical protein LMG3431_00626 [Achromobacter pestifer]